MPECLVLPGISSDMREIEMAKDKGDERAALALEMYDYKVKKYIGSYIAAMGGPRYFDYDRRNWRKC